MLKRVSIQNFKSLKDVTLDLQKVNLLIGPNNSGKTNFLKALEFMKFTYQSPYGPNEIMGLLIESAYKKDSYSGVSIKVLDQTENDIRSYRVGINHHNRNPYKICNLHENIFNSESEDDYTKTETNYINVFQDFTYNNSGFVLVFNQIKIYRPDPNRIIEPAIFSADATELKGDCSNLIQFLFYLNTNYKRAYHQIERDLAKCIGDFVSLSTPPVKVGDESKLGLKFFDTKDRGYWAEEVSEGVLYFLALLCIINQPDPPKLLLLEEPEKGIHPRRIREVMDFIFRLAEEKDVQIILTTHNEHVLDDFSTRPESVFVFDKDEEGATYVRNLQRDIIEPTNAKNKELGLDDIDLTTNLSENWLYGLLGGVPSIL